MDNGKFIYDMPYAKCKARFSRSFLFISMSYLKHKTPTAIRARSS